MHKLCVRELIGKIRLGFALIMKTLVELSADYIEHKVIRDSLVVDVLKSVGRFQWEVILPRALIESDPSQIFDKNASICASDPSILPMSGVAS